MTKCQVKMFYLLQHKLQIQVYLQVTHSNKSIIFEYISCNEEQILIRSLSIFLGSFVQGEICFYTDCSWYYTCNATTETLYFSNWFPRGSNTAQMIEQRNILMHFVSLVKIPICSLNARQILRSCSSILLPLHLKTFT